MYNVTQIKEHLTGMGHGGTLNKVRNIYPMFERSGSKFLLKNKPLTSMRTASLTSGVYDDIYNYGLPSDFLSLIDLIPQDGRESWDNAYRLPSGQFDLEKAIKQRTVAIEGSEGTKVIRINWRTRKGKLINAMESLTANGTWSAVGSATGLKANSIFKVQGAASVEFDTVVTGDGIQNTTMTSLDLTNEDEVGDFFVSIFLPSAPTSITARWGNDLTTKYWNSVAQTTQADGTAFRAGWNILKFPWATATETGTVDPTLIDSFRIIITNATALANVRVDNIICAIGRNFDIKYYSKFLFKNSAGTWIAQPTTDDDTVVVDADGLPLYLFELLKDMAHQMEGTDSAFDINYARQELQELFPHFRAENPNQSKKQRGRYGGLPRLKR